MAHLQISHIRHLHNHMGNSSHHNFNSSRHRPHSAHMVSRSALQVCPNFPTIKAFPHHSNSSHRLVKGSSQVKLDHFHSRAVHLLNFRMDLRNFREVLHPFKVVHNILTTFLRISPPVHLGPSNQPRCKHLDKILLRPNTMVSRIDLVACHQHLDFLNGL